MLQQNEIKALLQDRRFARIEELTGVSAGVISRFMNGSHSLSYKNHSALSDYFESQPERVKEQIEKEDKQ